MCLGLNVVRVIYDCIKEGVAFKFLFFRNKGGDVCEDVRGIGKGFL